MLFFLYIILAISTKCDELIALKMYTPEEMMECVDSLQITSANKIKMLSGLKHLYTDIYAYNDILKNPPQPAFDSNYYTKDDIIARIDALDVTDGPLYSFYYELKQIIRDANDLHLSVSLNSVNANKNNYFIDNIYYLLPFTFDIDENKTLRLLPQANLVGDIEKHKNESVVSINGLPPFDVIRAFGAKNVAMKAPSARFTYALTLMPFASLNRNPLTKAEFSQTFTITYESGDVVTVPYYFKFVPLTSLSQKSQIKLRNLAVGSNFSPLKYEDIFPLDLSEKPLKKDYTIDEEFSFDFSDTTKDYQCKVFNDKKINLLVLKSFSFNTIEEYISIYNTLSNCSLLFDQNKYPISVILPLNGGGYIDLGLNIEKFLAPHTDENVITTVRSSELSAIETRTSTGAGLVNPADCTIRYNSTDTDNSDKDLGEWFNEYQTVDYGNGALHNRTQPSYMFVEEMVEMKLVNNPRKPHEIVIFTDSFCYSTCSFFTKGLNERGEAIIVGYVGDPEGDIEHFDVGQSPSSVIQGKDIADEEQKALYDMGVSTTVTYFETYKFNYDLTETVPREFIPNEIDERVDIYGYSEDKIDLFMDKALEIVEKYKTECNSRNKRLVKETSECDSKITIEHAHGGYLCGDDNKWTPTCAASYCDDGYKFDYKNQKCIEDVCHTLKEDDDTWIWITIGVVGGVLFLAVVIAIIVAVVMYFMKKKKKSEYSALS
ncbi:hypothetical protein EIN_488260 [Entamoeba invadens IP1]|uniref:Uncharacterized protein n=1 Tax=Entamoeba invadens IP1 TaxID=370355 RepID=A0A0A1U521_ENTIV|nr:hypothetical protein EIN_488260 [Entamoeba invadens IP1]ELP89294.1 hypothetical protein EIN_488260 [Entamoeba invadens IP1]|eukprot:XP_004256065.1 hypothetical protein EIN_488260 [Entamoeba invadens IP1]